MQRRVRAQPARQAAVRLVTGIAVSLLCIAVAQPSPLPERRAVAITGVTVVDVTRGGPNSPRTVVIDNGRIVAIEPAQHARVPAQALRVDGGGRFLIPGLVDMHVHLFNLSSRRPPNDWSFPLYIANGVTGVREMRGDAASMALVAQWRKALDAGEFAVPRILAAGIAVYGNSPQDATGAVDAAAAAGADFIKVFSDVPVAHWRAVLAAAQGRALPVAGHVPAGVTLLEAAAAGQRSSEHLMQAYEACSTSEAALLAERHSLQGDALVALRDAQEARALAAFNPDLCGRVAKTLAATGQAQVPTLVLANEDSIDGGSLSADPRWRYLRADERARWQKFLAGYSAQDAALARQRWPVAHRIVAAMHDAGASILAGTDAPMPGVYPGFSLHEEMALLVESGLTPRQALRAATLAPAEFLGIAATTGSVTVGKRADLVLLDADPTRNIRNSRRIFAVVLDGRLLRRADLDALLQEAASAQR